MLMVSEQQTFIKLRIAPVDFSSLSDEEAMAYVVQLQGEREKEIKAKRTKGEKAETKPRGKMAMTIEDME
jgi:hypothetical protein